MTVTAPPRIPEHPRFDPDALFAEARRRRRQRRVRVAAVSVALIAVAVGVYWALAGGAARGTAAGSRPAGAAPRDKVVILLVDVSGSMRADDLKPTRLDAAVAAMRTFLTALPSQVEVGLISFSTSTRVVVQPTLDRSRLRAGLQSLAPLSGTALGDGLEAAVKLTRTILARQGIGRGPDGLVPATIVLESDGGQNAGTLMPRTAAEAAKDAGIRVEGIAIGASTGSVPFGFGDTQTRVPVPPDAKSIAQIAKLTGGREFTATTAERLTAIYRSLASTL